MKRLALLCLALLLCLAVPAAAADKTSKHSEKQTQKEHIPPATSFERFSAVLPQGWTGEDQSGFHSGDNREYMLMIGKKGDTSFEAALTIFILPPDRDTLLARLVGRDTEDPEVIRARLEKATRELSMAKDYDYQIVNDDLSKAVDTIRSIISSRLG